MSDTTNPIPLTSDSRCRCGGMTCAGIDECARLSDVIVTTPQANNDKATLYDELVAAGISPAFATGLSGFTP